MIISSIHRYHPEFVIMCVDNLLERITLGLEQNDFKYNQRRISEAKYLGELYNYKMVDSPVIFDALYRIVGFGHRKCSFFQHTAAADKFSKRYTNARSF